jgi:hypothetical protein
MHVVSGYTPETWQVEVSTRFDKIVERKKRAAANGQAMIIKAYIKLQDCTSSDRQAFIGRGRSTHGIAQGAINFYLVEGHSWAHIRRVLEAFDVMSAKVCTPETVCAFSADIGEAQGKLHKLTMEEIAQVALQPSTLRFAI